MEPFAIGRDDPPPTVEIRRSRRSTFRAGGGRDPGWCHRLAKVGDDVAHGGVVVDEGEDAQLHLGNSSRTTS